MNPDKPTLHQALIEARKAIPAIAKTAKNPHFGNAYAPLGAILAAVLPALHERGLCLTSAVMTDQPVPRLRVCIFDGTERVESDIPLVGATDMQRLGGAMTYALRYAIGSLLALELEEDTDGNTATGPAQAPRIAQETRTAPPKASGQASATTCPRCQGVLRQIKSGVNAGLWSCMKWPEKNMHGCGARWTSPDAVLAEWQRRVEPIERGEALAGVTNEPEYDANDPRALPF